MKKILFIITLILFNTGVYSQDETVNGKLTVKSNTDAITTYQTLDNSWLYSEWRNSGGTRKAYMGLNSNLSEFIISLENGANELIIPSGKVGIGTYNPISSLHVVNNGRTAVRIGGPNTSNGAVSDLVFVPSNGGKIGDSNYWDWSFRTDSWANSPGDLVLYSNNGTSYTSPIIVQSDGDVALVTGNGALRNGNVGIGTNNPDSKLTVKGKVHAEEVKVDLSVPGPDYVFKEGYNLRSLEEVQNYIEQNGHLPNIPSAEEMETDGVELGIMNMKLLEKIEELTLYVLELKEEINSLKMMNND